MGTSKNELWQKIEVQDVIKVEVYSLAYSLGLFTQTPGEHTGPATCGNPWLICHMYILKLSRGERQLISRILPSNANTATRPGFEVTTPLSRAKHVTCDALDHRALVRLSREANSILIIMTGEL